MVGSANKRGTITRTVNPASSAVQIKLFGQWAQAKKVVNNLEEAIAIGSLAGQWAAAKKIRELVRKKIRENGGTTSWPAYSEKYLKYKRSKRGGKTGQMYRFNDNYYNNITTWRSGAKIHVGLTPRIAVMQVDGQGRKNITLHQLAQILEYGSDERNIQARPLWGPVRKDFGIAKVKALMMWHISRAISSKTGVKPNTKI